MTNKEYPVLKTPKGFAIRIWKRGGSFEISTNDDNYQELLSGQKGVYDAYRDTEEEAIAFLLTFGKKHNLELFSDIDAFTLDMNHRKRYEQ